MSRRTVIFLTLLVSLSTVVGRADGLQADGPGADDAASRTFSTTAPTNANPNLLFRNELTNVEVKDYGAAPSVRDLAAGTVYSGKAVTLKQDVSDSFSIESRSAVNALQSDEWAKAELLDGSPSANSSTSAQANLAAKWKPVDPLVVSLSTVTESTSSRDREMGKNYQSRDAQEVKTEWTAMAGTKLSLSLNQERLKTQADLSDARTTTMARFSQSLGKTNLTLSYGSGYRTDRPDETNPSSTMTGSVNDATLSWTPSKVTTFSVGASWAEMAGASVELAKETTRNFFLNWNRVLSPNVNLQAGASYGTETDSMAGIPYWEGEQGTVWIGQSVTLSDTATARFDVSRYIAQETVWGTKSDESMATFSLKKMF